MIDVKRRGQRLRKLRGGIVVGPRTALLEHHVTLRKHHFVGELQAGHAIGLEGHYLFEIVLRHALEIGGVVLRREGVFLAADGGDDIREAPRGFSQCP